MCIGPVGFDMLVPGYVRFCYDHATIPAGTNETDLRLLEWDDAAGFMRVSQTATQDLVNHCFEDTAYAELGHIGVGFCVGPNRNFVFQGNPPPIVIRTQGLAPFVPDQSLIVADDTGEIVPLGLPNTQYANLYIPARNGAQILFRYDIPDVRSALRAVDAQTGDVLFESNPSLNLQPWDPLFGWFPDAAHLFFVHRQDAAALEVASFFDVFADSTIGGATHENLRDGPLDHYLKDIRVSPDGARVLLRYQDVFFGGERADVIATATGAIVGSDLPVLPNGSSSPMPRWLPDSSGLYFVDSLGSVSSINPDGTGLAVLYTASSAILDFSLEPGISAVTPTTRCAYIRTTSAPIQAEGGSGPSTYFDVDVVAGGSLVEQDLGSVFSVSELAYHPDGNTVWCELFDPFSNFLRTGIVAPGFGSFVAVFDSTTTATNRLINANMGSLDISRGSGSVLLWMQSGMQDAQFPVDGFWKLNADGTGGDPVSTGSYSPIGPARYLDSWRGSCAEYYSPYVR